MKSTSKSIKQRNIAQCKRNKHSRLTVKHKGNKKQKGGVVDNGVLDKNKEIELSDLIKNPGDVDDSEVINTGGPFAENPIKDVEETVTTEEPVIKDVEETVTTTTNPTPDETVTDKIVTEEPVKENVIEEVLDKQTLENVEKMAYNLNKNILFNIQAYASILKELNKNNKNGDFDTMLNSLNISEQNLKNTLDTAQKVFSIDIKTNDSNTIEDKILLGNSAALVAGLGYVANALSVASIV